MSAKLCETIVASKACMASREQSDIIFPLQRRFIRFQPPPPSPDVVCDEEGVQSKNLFYTVQSMEGFVSTRSWADKSVERKRSSRWKRKMQSNFIWSPPIGCAYFIRKTTHKHAVERNREKTNKQKSLTGDRVCVQKPSDTNSIWFQSIFLFFFVSPPHPSTNSKWVWQPVCPLEVKFSIGHNTHVKGREREKTCSRRARESKGHTPFRTCMGP